VQRYIEHRLALAGRVRSQGFDKEAERAGQAATGVEFRPDAVQAVTRLSGGVPRLINILCDRSLEAAYGLRMRTIDMATVNTAAYVVGIASPPAPAPQSVPVKPEVPESRPEPRAETRHQPLVEARREPPVETRPEPPIETAIGQTSAPDNRPHARPEPPIETHVEPAAPSRIAPDLSSFLDAPASGAEPLTFGAESSTPSSRKTAVLVAASLAVAFAAVWFGLRAMNSPAGTEQPVQSQSPPARPAPAPPAEAPRVETPPSTTAPSVATAPAAGERFEIVVASFRTEARAATVAAEVTALDMPTRRRTTEGWLQVLAGPFASRAQAEEAQQRLDRAGLTGTQIVPSAR
jgi:hypothetical protein